MVLLLRAAVFWLPDGLIYVSFIDMFLLSKTKTHLLPLELMDIDARCGGFAIPFSLQPSLRLGARLVRKHAPSAE